MKKIALLLVAVALIFSCLTVNVFAADAVSIIVSDAAAGRDGEMEVTISVTENPGFITMQLLVEYDQSVLELIGVTDARMYGNAMHTKDLTKYPYPLTWNNGTAEENYTNCDKMVTLKFKVKSDASFGSTEINVSLKPGGCLNYDMNKLPLNDVAPAKATVICPHTNATKVDETAATCTEDGNPEYYSCPDCKKNFTTAACDTEIDSIVTEALGHKMTKVDAEAATCIKEGNIEYWHCEQCDKNFADEKGETEAAKITTDMVDHTLGEYVTDKDNHWKVCSVCNEIIGKTAHVPGDPESHSDATCTEPEMEGAIKCVDCGYVISSGREVNPALGHDTTHHAYKDSTCTEEGNEEYWDCARCGKKYSDKECTTEIADTVIPMKPHTYTNTPKDPADHHKSGMEEYNTCDVCKKIFDADKKETTLDALVIPQVPHDEVTVWSSDADGHWHECSCGDKLDFVAHTAGDPESHTAATCTEPETFGAVKCTICDYVISKGDEGEPALGHDKQHHEFNDSTCTELGNNEYWECKRCGKKYSDEACTIEITDEKIVIGMKEHIYENHPEDPADHHKSGMEEYYTCQTCDKVFDASKKETTLDALVITQVPHDNFTAWTTDDNEHWHQCSCGDKFDVAAHEGEERDRTEPTCTEAGSEGGIYCKVCNKLLVPGGNVIDALGHDMVEVAAKDPTCYASGNVHYWHCDRCDLNYADAEGTELINDVTVTQLKHIFDEGKCVLCGAPDPDYYRGPSVVAIDDHYHGAVASNGVMTYQPHTPSIFGVQTDGKYQWNICAVCGAAYNKIPVVDSDPDNVTVTDPDDTDEIVVSDPVESNNPDEEPEEPENATVKEPEPEDTNPKTGITVSLFAVAAAAFAVAYGKKR